MEWHSHLQPARMSTARTAGWRWAIAGALCGTLCATLWFAPARWLAGAVESASRGMVILQAPRGSVWTGSAQLIFSGGSGSRGQTALPGRMRWRLRPRLNGLHLSVTADCCTPGGPLRLTAAPSWGGGSLYWTGGILHWPAAFLVGLGTPWNTIQPEGEVTLVSDAFQARWKSGRLELQGSATATFDNMASRLTSLRPAGSYRAVVQGGPPIQVTLSTLSGALQLSGHGQWLGNRLRFRGEAGAAPGHEAQLANLLNAIGERRGNTARMALN